MTLLSVMAYHSFSGEVEASNTPTIRRLIPLGRHQLPRLARPMQYRLYRIKANHVAGPPIEIDADDDWEAARKAGDYLETDDLQVWQDDRFVIEFERKRENAH
jgi:hypothetical protein